MQNKTYSQREFDKEVKKQTAINMMMEEFSKSTSDLNYPTLMESLALAQETILICADSEDPARTINYGDVRLFFSLSHDLIRLVKPLMEIATGK